MLRLLSALPLLLLALASPAGAATVTADAPVPRTCKERLAEGAAGVAVERYTAKQAGVVTVTLDGRDGDWDLALFNGAGELDTASASFGARERAVAYLRAGDTLAAQACRRRGDTRTAALAFDLYPYVPPAVREPARIVHVELGGADTLERLEATGLDVTHAHSAEGADVVVYSDRETALLRREGFSFTTEVSDLRALDLRTARADAERSPATARALPSGRTTYRTAADYADDLKSLAEDNPSLVKPVRLGTSLEGRAIEGVEISENVSRTDDGRPVLALLGIHHAREWPSGEMPMEFALDIVARYKANEARPVDVLRRARILVVPIMNPDGFAVSRSANGGITGPNDDNGNATLGQAATDSGAYKRKNCRPTMNDAAIPCALRNSSGVDLNRNYGAYWGGRGASTSTSSQSYRGTAPYSEPESEAFHKLSQTRSPVTVISHHTYTVDGKWLRQPGFCMVPPDGCQFGVDIVPDEAGMKALGDGMAQATGWNSNLGWDFNGVSEITGATEDWNYFATGAYGYTPEQRGTNFHPSHATAVVAEYDGSGAGANGGVREALLRAAEQAADDAQHSVLTGTAPAGTTLRLSKSFSTPTSVNGVAVADKLDLTMQSPASGRFVWDVNPSTRPLSGAKEAYTLTCERGGAVIASRQVVVDRGRQLDVGDACAAPPASATEQSSGSIGAQQPNATGPAATDRRLALGLRLDRRQRLATVLRRGVLVRATCAVDCTLGTSVRRSRLGTVFGRRTLKLAAGKRAVFRVKLSRAARRTIVRRRLSRVALRLDARSPGQRRVTARSITLVRR